MESYDIEKNMENTCFIDETNVHPTLSNSKINKGKLNLQTSSFKNFIESTPNKKLL
jgi:hypothetical protein